MQIIVDLIFFPLKIVSVLLPNSVYILDATDWTGRFLGEIIVVLIWPSASIIVYADKWRCSRMHLLNKYDHIWTKQGRFKDLKISTLCLLPVSSWMATFTSLMAFCSGLWLLSLRGAAILPKQPRESGGNKPYATTTDVITVRFKIKADCRY